MKCEKIGIWVIFFSVSFVFRDLGVIYSSNSLGGIKWVQAVIILKAFILSRIEKSYNLRTYYSWLIFWAKQFKPPYGHHVWENHVIVWTMLRFTQLWNISNPNRFWLFLPSENRYKSRSYLQSIQLLIFCSTTQSIFDGHLFLVNDIFFWDPRSRCALSKSNIFQPVSVNHLYVCTKNYVYRHAIKK